MIYNTQNYSKLYSNFFIISRNTPQKIPASVNILFSQTRLGLIPSDKTLSVLDKTPLNFSRANCFFARLVIIAPDAGGAVIQEIQKYVSSKRSEARRNFVALIEFVCARGNEKLSPRGNSPLHRNRRLSLSRRFFSIFFSRGRDKFFTAGRKIYRVFPNEFDGKVGGCVRVVLR